MENDTAVINGSTNELRLNVYMFFMARTAELKAPESVWLEWLDRRKN